MISPDEIRLKAERAYPKMLSAWARDSLATFFPWHVPGNLSPIAGDLPATIASVDRLRAGSKEVRGKGYSVQWRQIRSRDFGNNRFPERIVVETADDLVALAGRERHFATTRNVAEAVRERLPSLAGWVASNIRTIADRSESLDGLLAVTEFFLQCPWPDCYARQIPVAVDTKFVERNQAMLRQWLDLLLPASAIQADETKFALRFGLRDGQPHTTVRVLDPDLQLRIGLPFDELSLPLRSLETLSVQGATVIVVENQLNLLTLPPLCNGLVIRGEGRAVTRLRRLKWFGENRLVYWGDIDVEGFQILSNLRMYFPHAESFLMDESVLQEHLNLSLDGSGDKPSEPRNLLPRELAAFRRCAQKNQRLEQERLPQGFVDQAFARL